MKTDDINSIILIPAFMREDETVKGLAAAFDTIFSKIVSKMYYANIWKNIERLTNGEMDFVGKTLNIPWYHDSFTIEQKQIVLYEYRNLYYNIGTSGSIIQLLNSIYGDAEISEWYEYDGSPFHFKIRTENATAVNEKAELFLRLLDRVKKATAILDEIEIESSGSNYIYLKSVSIESTDIIKGVSA